VASDATPGGVKQRRAKAQKAVSTEYSCRYHRRLPFSWCHSMADD
jgi:hypothetical protein